MRLQDVMKYQPKRDNAGSSSKGTGNRNRNRNRNGNQKLKKKKGSAIRPGASIEKASRRREEAIELDDDSDEESSVEQVRYQNPARKKSHSAINVDGESGGESSKGSEEDEIPYRMNFSQPNREPQKSSDSFNSDSSDSDDNDDDDDDFSYDSPVEHKKAPAEPLRPGDVIEYQNTTIFTAGLDIGHNTAKVLGTAPGAKFPLKLSTGDYLDATVRIRRSHECIKGKLYKHAGYWKPISFFRLRKRLLRNPDGTPVEPQGGVFGRAKAFQNIRENLHQKAVEYVRGDHDDRIGIDKTGDGSSEKPAAKSSRTNAKNRDNGRKNDNNNKDDDSSTTSSSSSSEGSELRLEFERLSRERNKQLRKNKKNKHNKPSTSIRKSPPLLPVEDSDSDSDSDSDLDIPRKKSSQNQPRPSLLLKRIPRLCTDDTRNKLLIVPSITSKINAEKRSTTDKPIDDSIDINSKSKKKRQSEKYKISDHLSISSSSSSSIGNVETRKPPVSKKRSSPPSTIFAKVDDPMRPKELLDDDSDSSGDDYLILNKAFPPPKKSLSKSQAKRPPTTTTTAKHKKKSPPRKSYSSPMEENPVDLFEDSSSDDGSTGGSDCRKRNRRGERMLRSPSVDLIHRKQKRQTTNRDDWLTQEDCASERHTALSTKQSPLPHKTVKRSVVVGYRPLSLSIDGIHQEVRSSPPSLAKAYRKREARLQRKREAQSIERNDLASEALGKRRCKKKKHERSKEMKFIDKGESNRRKLQREKLKLKRQHKRPPPYPPKRSDPLLVELSTQENEWTDMEQDTESKHCIKNEKNRNWEHSKKMRSIAEASSCSSPDSKPTPKKRSTISNHKQSFTEASQSFIGDSCDEEKQSGRKRLTPKSRLRKNSPKSKPRDEQSRNQTKHNRYELSSSSSESAGEVQRRPPRTPCSTDCEIDSPLPSTIEILNSVAPRHSADIKDSRKSSGKRKKFKKHHNRKPDVFRFPSQDENEDPTDGSCTKRRPNLANLSKRNSSKQKSTRKR